MEFKRLWLFSYLIVMIMLFEFALTVPVVQQQQQNRNDIDSRTSNSEHNNIVISDNSISTNDVKQNGDNNNPPLYPSPGLDLEQELIGTSTQDILGRVGTATATCLVAGVEYTHGQQIYRADQCEFCLCLDGEMFCWWQDCPPTVPEIPCRDRFPFSGPPCNYPPVNDVSPFSSPYFQPSSPNQPTTDEHQQQQSSTTNKQQQHIETSTNNMLILNNKNNNTTLTTKLDTKNNNKTINLNISTNVVSNESLSVSSSMLTVAGSTTTNENSTQQAALASISTITSLDGLSETTIITTTTVPTVCVVMGIEYKIGEILPHDTGNCLQCVCGDGARVTCSPYQCAPSEEDEDLEDGVPPLYRPSSGRRSDLDLF